MCELTEQKVFQGLIYRKNSPTKKKRQGTSDVHLSRRTLHDEKKRKQGNTNLGAKAPAERGSDHGAKSAVYELFDSGHKGRVSGGGR